MPGKPKPALLVGTPDAPIPAKFSALVRLHYLPGMDRDSCPAVVCCGGRMEFHGRALVPLLGEAEPDGRSRIKCGRAGRGGRGLEGGRPGHRHQHPPAAGVWPERRKPFGEASQTEERRVVAANSRGPGPAPGDARVLRLDRPLQFEHHAEGNYRAEVANLSRNVVVESADPASIRGHTMYHRHSTGSLGYAEFRHLGKKDILGRYALHFHLCGDTMRGSLVQGLSIWDSHNRWLTVHGTQYLVVRDCVGYRRRARVLPGRRDRGR